MTLLRLKAAPIILIEDNLCNNTIPLLLELAPQDRSTINFFCFEHQETLWRNVFQWQSNVIFHSEIITDSLDSYISEKCTVIIDSVYQMSLCLGWNKCLEVINKFKATPNVSKLVLILHADCLYSASKLRLNLNHLSSAIITYDQLDSSKVQVLLKKSGKVVKSEETLFYDKLSSTLRLTPVVKVKTDVEEPAKPSPENLTTFKIEVGQNDKIHKNNLKLPYMSKIHDGESKIYYEPDAVDDWDEEDPDEDLDI